MKGEEIRGKQFKPKLLNTTSKLFFKKQLLLFQIIIAAT